MLPKKARVVWEQEFAGGGLAGIAATKSHVVVAGRSPLGTEDLFLCYAADSGKRLWELRYPADGELDYGNSPRATPLIHDGRVYLLGALGHLYCVSLEDGLYEWSRDLFVEFPADERPIWGMCSSPLIVDGQLIINPGAPDAALVALDAETGETLWETPGFPPGYASFIVGTFGNVRQIVGYDKVSLGGWSVKTGKRLWKLVPPQSDDFNVPTPIAVGGRLLVTTENNGTRLYEFAEGGTINPEPVAQNDDLAPDTSTPVVLGNRVFGCWSNLFCLDLDNGLKPIWTGEDQSFRNYVSLIAGEGRVLVTTTTGELLLVDAGAPQLRIISRMRAFEEDSDLHSHPALVGTKLYIRNNDLVRCLELEPPSPRQPSN